jgi:hypothetical protein
MRYVYVEDELTNDAVLVDQQSSVALFRVDLNLFRGRMSRYQEAIDAMNSGYVDGDPASGQTPERPRSHFS